MPVAKCVRNCFDGNVGRLYYRGDVVEDMSSDHPFLKTGCFIAEKQSKKAIPEFEDEESQVEPEKRRPGRPKDKT